MNKRWMARTGAAVAALAALAACGGGDDGAAPPFGLHERQLYDARHHLAGEVPRRGSGAVVLHLEPDTAQALPLVGDTADAGTDAVWLDVVSDSVLGVRLTEQSLGTVGSVSLLDLAGAQVWRADTAAREAGVGVLRGPATAAWPRYQLRLTPSAAATKPAQVIVWMGHAAQRTHSATDLARVAGDAPANCAGCNLQGTQLGGYTLAGGNLGNANLRNAWLAAVDPALLELPDVLAFALFLDASVVRGAQLNGANLSGADLTGAIVNGAGVAPASLAGANLSRAVLNDLILDGADLSAANLSQAQARAASFIASELGGANLSGLDLRGANLAQARLNGANLSGANLTGSRLVGADLSAANLTGATLTGALLGGATWTDGRVCAPASVGSCGFEK